MFEIILRVTEGKTFKEAFEMILPKRKEKKEVNSNDESVETKEDILNNEENSIETKQEVIDKS